MLGVPPHHEERESRRLTPAETRVRLWIKANHGVLSKVAREFQVSVTFVQRIAYNREAQSAGLKIEMRLRSLACPLIQRF